MLKIKKVEHHAPNKIMAIIKYEKEEIITISNGEENVNVSMKFNYEDIDGEKILSLISFNDGEYEIIPVSDDFVPVLEPTFNNQLHVTISSIVVNNFPTTSPDDISDINKIVNKINNIINSFMEEEVVNI